MVRRHWNGPGPTRGLILLTALVCLAATPATPVVDLAAAKRLLPTSVACDDVACLIEQAYRPDAKASRLALELFQATGDVAGIGPEEVLDGGFRGTIKLVPQLPRGGYRKHLSWVSSGAQAVDHFFDGFPGARW